MVKENRWDDGSRTVPVDLYGKTVLVVGFGKIGTALGQALPGHGDATCWSTTPTCRPRRSAAAGYEPVADLDAALARADFVTIHCPKTPETVGMFNAARLARMKPTAYLVNTARGGIIDEPALHDALTGKKSPAPRSTSSIEEPTPARQSAAATRQLHLRAAHGRRHPGGRRRAWACRPRKNMLSVLDGTPNRENVVNKEVLG